MPSEASDLWQQSKNGELQSYQTLTERELIEKENSRRVKYYLVVDKNGQIIILTKNKTIAISVLKHGL